MQTEVSAWRCYRHFWSSAVSRLICPIHNRKGGVFAD
nr:MAG TPA: hypothetical protein [Inoviridae sp.]